MLVCSISSLRAPRGLTLEIIEAIAAADAASAHIVGIAVEIVEATEAADTPSTGLIFATLIDDPASVNETVDAYLGEMMLEAASAADDLSTGSIFAAAIDEVLTAAATQDGDTTAAPVFTTWNPSDLANITLTNSNLTAAGNTPAVSCGVRAVHGHTSGKYYWEYKFDFIQTNSQANGIALASLTLSSNSLVGAAVMGRLGGIVVNNSGTGVSLGTRAANDIIGIAVDFTAQLIWFRVAPAGNWNNSGTANPATGTGGISISAISSSGLFPVFMAAANLDKNTANFGATAFSGSVPSGFTSGFTS